MKFTYAVPAGLLAASILFTGCANNNNSTNTATNSTTATNTPTTAAATNTPETAAADFTSAIDQYRTYVIQQCDEFVKQTESFTNAVKEDKIDEAKALYAPARMYYERIEPIAEALGDLDPNIDARENDVDAAEWRGFHKLEKALWQDNTTKDMTEVADQLLKDAQLLRAKVETVEIDANLLVTGAVELLNEVSSSKVTGEEERYSHTDLYDFVANVEGAQKIYELLKPELAKKDADLEKTIGERFAALQAELAPFKSGDGYVSYEELKEDEVRKLSQNLDALAEPLSNMGTILGV
ncbi:MULTISPECIES: iron uptake system protein EfeO [Paenibacillus]|uniref:iron uptake system protein EfeO n=1 Tax=Paenibacillus TaxID=44249 RepID=UPI0003E2BE53|nr:MULTISPECIES: iron uptake system protein EfeO [Paenibacillus]ETT63979.1 periplasmic lipoprotein involved in iron transport [Paenibacillus sp. FSL H8-237]MEC0135119.1 imelysin family protein [Paenibacillus odorifer]MEC0223337.1 imelysin family protein [Paenibacillus odorifer]OMD00025.1 Efem/EfeO family lipoprotein [Paenibacillus odorifer]OMD04817.1 Efem/EfeO family lipoprotein [Paenibacillus odorifer]